MSPLNLIFRHWIYVDIGVVRYEMKEDCLAQLSAGVFHAKDDNIIKGNEQQWLLTDYKITELLSESCEVSTPIFLTNYSV